MWAIGERITFAVCLICVEYFYRAEKGVREANEPECMDLAFAPEIHYEHSCSLTESHSGYLFCVCAQLGARIWLNKRRIPELLTEK